MPIIVVESVINEGWFGW